MARVNDEIAHIDIREMSRDRTLSWVARGILVWLMVKYGHKRHKDVYHLPFRELVARLAHYGDTERNVVEAALREIGRSRWSQYLVPLWQQRDRFYGRRKRVAELSKEKEPPRKLIGPPKDMPPAKYLDFELLPPGSWDFEDVLKHYKRLARRKLAEFAGKRLDWRRIREIQKLKPIDVYIGKKMWVGYAVYTFKRTTAVVLECPFEGNATYILAENWKRAVKHTKQYVRRHYDNRKVVHKGEWLDRVQFALGL